MSSAFPALIQRGQRSEKDPQILQNAINIFFFFCVSFGNLSKAGWLFTTLPYTHLTGVPDPTARAPQSNTLWCSRPSPKSTNPEELLPSYQACVPPAGSFLPI